MIAVSTVYIFGALCLIISLVTSAYYVLCLNPDLMKDILFLWVTLLVSAVVAVLDFLYFVLFFVFFFLRSRLAFTITDILRGFEPYFEILVNFSFVTLVIIYNPAHGNDDGILQLIIIALVGFLKTFLVYAGLVFNYDASRYFGIEQEKETEMERRGPYAFVPSKDFEKEEVQSIQQPVFLLPAKGLVPVYLVK